MDAAIARALALTPATRLVAVDAADLVDATGLAVYAAFGTVGSERRAVADPLRLPLVEAVADVVVTRWPSGSDAGPRLRELWRILAPAGRAVVIVALPPSRLKRLLTQGFIRRRTARALAAAMLEIVSTQVTADALVIEAVKRDGLAPLTRATSSRRKPGPMFERDEEPALRG